ncbi:MAG: hypothetical protein HS111_20355 [Kofleriaceae bacterium]|nr:hypothetical protein [Kofleriaceae bacterium]MCL4225325.1 hypothetical protein [Myxococcales bacterium]
MSTTPDADDWGPVRAAAARAVAALAGRADEVPDGGGFEPVVERFAVAHPGWTAGAVELRLGASPRLTMTGTEPTDARYVDVVVLSPSGGSETTRTILRGTTTQVFELLRSLEVPRQVVTTLRDLAETQRRLGLV